MLQTELPPGRTARRVERATGTGRDHRERLEEEVATRSRRSLLPLPSRVERTAVLEAGVTEAEPVAADKVEAVDQDRVGLVVADQMVRSRWRMLWHDRAARFPGRRGRCADQRRVSRCPMGTDGKRSAHGPGHWHLPTPLQGTSSLPSRPGRSRPTCRCAVAMVRSMVWPSPCAFSESGSEQYEAIREPGQ